MQKYFRNGKLLEKLSNDYDYAVAWLDCSAKNESFMRGIFSTAKFITNIENDIILKEKINRKINNFLKKKISILRNLFSDFFGK